MRINEVRDSAIKAAVDMKEHVTKKRRADTRPLLQVYRGDVEIAGIFFTGVGGRDNLLRLFALAASGFDADTMCMTFEGYSPGPNLHPPHINPRTGKEFESGEMSELFEDGGEEAGLIRECMMITVANRAGDIRAACLPFHYVGGRHLVWDDERRLVAPDDMESHGIMPEAMIEAMNSPSLSQIIQLVMSEPDRATADGSVARLLTLHEHCSVVLWAEEGGDRARVLARYDKRIR